MDVNVQRLLNDKIYDKRKQGAFEYVYTHFSVHPLTDQDLRNSSVNAWQPRIMREYERSSINFVTNMPMLSTNLTLVMAV